MPSTTSPLERVARAIAPDSATTTRQKIESLAAFNSVLHDVNLDQAQSIFSAVPLANFYLVFGSLDSEDNEEQQLSNIMCEVISKLLRPFSYDMIMQDENNQNFLSQGLNHFSPEIRQLSLEQVAKCLDASSTMHQVATSPIFPFVLTTIAFRDTGVASRAVDIAAKIASNEPECLFVNNASILRGLQGTSDAVRFRVYDLIIRVAGSSDDAFRLAESSGFLGPILDEVNSDDILVQLNAIEMLKEVAITPCGLDFLERSGVLQTLASQIGNSETNDTITILVKSLILKFFGKLGENEAIQFEPIQSKYQVFDKLQQCLDDTNKEILTVAIAVVGLIGSHAAGLALLLDSPLMSKFMEGYQASSGDVKAVYIQSLSKFIGISGDPAVEQMTRQVYQTINGAPSTLESLMQTATQPLEEIRVPIFALMQAIASHTWGREEMARAPTFLGYLLDRSTEHTPLGQKWKFGIVQTLVSAENSRQIFGQHYTLMLQFIRQGPYYRPTEAAAIMESA
ncbi:hypothetical protein O0I10_000012 [Lichtheimia ornata]|uniref:26S proteasome non-ATPase regulatory subunit 5 n=1 Tax=Lichtheimia ornata TaxID=688661 RepID=A0AAD7Y4S0_9FUNG|nr:uncharacterized protein O0I10_000012 [Lichtheimia ornata]KAJ8663739.1 hypothetical protein O0I10_000012 [Lichtheimia ornata]